MTPEDIKSECQRIRKETDDGNAIIHMRALSDYCASRNCTYCVFSNNADGYSCVLIYEVPEAWSTAMPQEDTPDA